MQPRESDNIQLRVWQQSVFTNEHLLHLLCPWQIGSFDHLHNRHSRWLAPNKQALKHVWRQVSQSHHRANETVGNFLGLGNILDRYGFAGFELSPPRP